MPKIKPKHAFKIGSRVLLISEIDMFKEHVGKCGVVTQATKDDLIVKFDDGNRICTYPNNLKLIEKD